jgi:1-acyl-sn-glycerol-3-phosphate acyltransferase
VGLAATVTGNLFLVFGTIVCATVAVLFGWLPPRGLWVHRMARIWSRGLLMSAGVRLATRFAAPLAADRPCVFMANHQSLYDIPALIAGLPGQTRFLAKRSLFQIPLFGWSLKMGGFISIDRADRSRAGESFADAIRELEAGASAVVFPEGTRSRDGNLLAFQRGGFLLALKSDLPIVPVGIHGSLAVRARNSLWTRPGRITVSCGRPIDVGEYGVRDKARLIEDVRRQVVALASPTD